MHCRSSSASIDVNVGYLEQSEVASKSDILDTDSEVGDATAGAADHLLDLRRQASVASGSPSPCSACR